MEQRRQDAPEPLHQAGLLGDAQEAQPQGQGAEQQDHHVDRELGHGEQAFHHRRPDTRVTADPAPQRGYCRHQEKSQPQAVEHVQSPKNQ
ncbi:hypothetical protein D3C81_2164680 [compost metagenome]